MSELYLFYKVLWGRSWRGRTFVKYGCPGSVMLSKHYLQSAEAKICSKDNKNNKASGWEAWSRPGISNKNKMLATYVTLNF